MTGWTIETGIESKLSARRRSWLTEVYSVKDVIAKCNLIDLSVAVDLKGVVGGVKSRDLGNIVVLTLTLLFLQLEGNATDRTLLDTLHQVGGEARDFVAQTFGWDESLTKWFQRKSF
jgi:hypothetical protein